MCASSYLRSWARCCLTRRFWDRWRDVQVRARTYHIIRCVRPRGPVRCGLRNTNWRSYRSYWRVSQSLYSSSDGRVGLTASRGWTYLFYLLGGMAVIPIVIGLLVIPKDDPSLRQVDEDRRIDWIGGFIVTAGLCLFCFSLTESGIAENGWSTPCKSICTQWLIADFQMYPPFSLFR